MLDLVHRPGYAIRRYIVKGGMCVCVCVCVTERERERESALHGKNENMLYSGEEGGEGGEKAREEQERVGSKILLEGLALLR